MKDDNRDPNLFNKSIPGPAKRQDRKYLLPRDREAFTMRVRKPGWLADEAMNELDEEPVFPDEMLGLNGSSFIPFFGKILGEVKEDPNNVWILGSDLVEPNAGADRGFYDFLMGLSVILRRYNASLYWLRMYHLASTGHNVKNLPGFPWELTESDGTTTKGTRLPSTIPALTTPEFKDGAILAEEDMRRSTCELREHIQASFKVENNDWRAIVDTVKSNDYIVSFRAVASPDADRVEIDGAIGPLEFGGSSSSHNPLSSTFSSSSSSSNP